MQHREPFDVQFVDNRLVPWRSWRAIVAPSERGVYDPTFEHADSVVTSIKRKVAVATSYPVTKVRIAPAQGSRDILCIRIQQEFIVIEAMALVWSIGAMHAISVEQTRSRVGQ